MIGCYLTYGIPLSDEFGAVNPLLVGRPKSWMEALIARRDGEEIADVRKFLEKHSVRQPTVEEPWLVAGYMLDEEKMDDCAYVGTLRTRWDELMADVDADIRDSLLAVERPKVQMIYGEF